jgi:hypothetical protein
MGSIPLLSFILFWPLVFVNFFVLFHENYSLGRYEMLWLIFALECPYFTIEIEEQLCWI